LSAAAHPRQPSIRARPPLAPAAAGRPSQVGRLLAPVPALSRAGARPARSTAPGRVRTDLAPAAGPTAPIHSLAAPVLPPCGLQLGRSSRRPAADQSRGSGA